MTTFALDDLIPCLKTLSSTDSSEVSCTCSVVSFGRYIRDSSLKVQLPSPPSHDRLGLSILPSEAIDSLGHWVDDSIFDVQLEDSEDSIICTFSPLLNNLFFNTSITAGTVIKITSTSTVGSHLLITNVEILGVLLGCASSRVFPAHITDPVPVPPKPLTSLPDHNPIFSSRKFFLPLFDNSLPLPSADPHISLSPLTIYNEDNIPRSLSEFLERPFPRYPLVACVTDCGLLTHVASSTQRKPFKPGLTVGRPLKFCFRIADSKVNIPCSAWDSLGFELWNQLTPGMFIVIEQCKLSKYLGENELKFNSPSTRVYSYFPSPSGSLAPLPPLLTSMVLLNKLPFMATVNVFGRIEYCSKVCFRRVTRGDFQLYRILVLAFNDLSVPLFLALSSKPHVFSQLSCSRKLLVTNVQIRSYTPNSLASSRSVLLHSTVFTDVIFPESGHYLAQHSIFDNFPLPKPSNSICRLPDHLFGLSKLFTSLRLVHLRDVVKEMRRMAPMEGFYITTVCKFHHEGKHHCTLSIDGVRQFAECIQSSLFSYYDPNTIVSPLLVDTTSYTFHNSLAMISGQKVVVLAWMERIKDSTFVEVCGIFPYSDGFVCFKSKD
ncbi:hypothetical protein P9112_002546 [Eukaryota sp. TZLM1-RC]